MPERTIKITGKSFQADYSQLNGNWKCELKALAGTIAVDGYGESAELALRQAQDKAAERIQQARREIFEGLLGNQPPPTEEEIRAVKNEWQI
jgi:hypothetical protein